jgi:hypothetical protein
VFERDSEEPFDLRRVQIDRDGAREAGGFDERGDDGGADCLAPGGPPILSRIPEVRHDGGQAGGARTATGIGQEEQLDEVLIGQAIGRLDHVHVVPADALLKSDVQFTVSEPVQRSSARRDAKLVGDARRKCRVR